jgi:hypothetical protein
MSSLHGTDVYRSLAKADRNDHRYGFVLVLICIALAVVVAGAVFVPNSIGNGISSETWFVGP